MPAFVHETRARSPFAELERGHGAVAEMDGLVGAPPGWQNAAAPPCPTDPLHTKAAVLTAALAFCLSAAAQAPGPPAATGASADAVLERWAEAKSGDDRKRRAVLPQLGNVDDPRATSALLEELGKAAGAYVDAVVRAIAMRPRPEAIAPLKEILIADATLPFVRRSAGSAIATAGHLGIDLLLAIVEDGDHKPSPAVRDACLFGLSTAKEERALRGLAVHAVQGTTPQRLEALRLLLGVKDNGAVTRARLVCAGESDELLAATAVRQLCEERHPRADELAANVADRAAKPPPLVIVELVLGLVALGEPASFPLLLRLAANEAVQVRMALRPAAALVARDPRLIEWLAREGLNSSQPAWRDASLVLLRAAPLEAIRPLVAKVRERLQRPTRQDLDLAIAMHEVLARDPTWKVQALALAKASDASLRTVGLDLLRELQAREGLEVAHRSVDHKEWEVRAAAYRFLAEVRELSSIPVLLTRVEKETGRLEADLDEALFRLTSRRGLTKVGWENWWRSNRDKHQLPPLELVVRPNTDRVQAGRSAATVAYFDIPLVSKRVAFLVDVSGSMAARIGTDRKHTRLDEARRELAHVFAAIPEDSLCNLIVYETTVKPVWETLRPARPMQKDELRKAIEPLKPGGGTNIHDALEQAFRDQDVDTIYLLTDGEPSAGAITNVDDLAAEVQRWNRVRQVVIHTIGIGVDGPLLKRLATESGGQYRYVR